MKKVIKSTLLVVFTLVLAVLSVVTLNVKTFAGTTVTKEELVEYHNNKIKPLIEAVDNNTTKYVSYTMKAEYDEMMSAYGLLGTEDLAFVNLKTDNYKWVVELGERLNKVEASVKAAVKAVNEKNIVAAMNYVGLQTAISVTQKDLASIYTFLERLDETERAAINDIYDDSDVNYTFADAWKDYTDACEHFATAKEYVDAYEAEVNGLYDSLLTTEGKLDNYFANKAAIEKLVADYTTLNDAAKGTPVLVENLCAGVSSAVVAKKDALSNGLKKSEDLIAEVNKLKSNTTDNNGLEEIIQANISDYPTSGTKNDGIYAENVKTALDSLNAKLDEIEAWDTSAYAEVSAAATLAENTETAYNAQQKEVDELADYFVNDLNIDKIVGTYGATKAAYGKLCDNQKAAFNKVAYGPKEVGSEASNLPEFKDCTATSVENLAEYKAYLDELYDYAKKTAEAYEKEIIALNYKFTYDYYQTLTALKEKLDAEPLYVTNAITSKAYVGDDLDKIDAEVKKADKWVAAVNYEYDEEKVFAYEDIADIESSYTEFNALSKACQQFLADNQDSTADDTYKVQYDAYNKYAVAAEVYEKINGLKDAADAAIADLKAAKDPEAAKFADYVALFDAAKAAVNAFAEGTTDNGYAYDLSEDKEEIADYSEYTDAVDVIEGYRWAIKANKLYSEDKHMELKDSKLYYALMDDLYSSDEIAYADLTKVQALLAEYEALEDAEKDVIDAYFIDKVKVAEFFAYLEGSDALYGAAIPLNKIIGKYATNALVKEFGADFDLDDYLENVISELSELVANESISTVADLKTELSKLTEDYITDTIKGNDLAVKYLSYKDIVDSFETEDLDELLEGIEELNSLDSAYSILDAAQFADASADIGIEALFKALYAYVTSTTLVPGAEVKSTDYDYDTLKFVKVSIKDLKNAESVYINDLHNYDAELGAKGLKKFQEVKDFCTYLSERLNSDIDTFISDYEEGNMFDITLEELKETYVIPAAKIENTLAQLDGEFDAADTQRWYILQVAKFKEIEDLISWKYFYATAASSLAEDAKAGYFTVEGYTELFDLKALYRQADKVYQDLVAEYFTELDVEITPLYEEKLEADKLQSYDTLRAELKKQIEDTAAELEKACEENKAELEGKLAALTQRMVEAEQGFESLSAALQAEKAAREAAQLTCSQEIAKLSEAVNANKAAISGEAASREAADAAEKSAREAADATEKAAREAADAAEESARKAAILAEESARKAADAAEAEAREAADANEAAAREAADAAEKAAREAADAAEKSAREAAILAEEEARQTADANEKAAREAADSELQAAIDDLNSKVKTITIFLVIVGVVALAGVILALVIKK